MIVSHWFMQRLNEMEPGGGDSIVRAFLIGYPVYLVIYFFVTLFIGRKLASVIAFPIRDLGETAKRLAHGEIDVALDYEAKDEIGVLVKEFRGMVDGIKTQASVLDTIADGDYTASLPIRSQHDVMNLAINELLQKNNDLLREIKAAATQVSTVAAQMAGAAQTLASGSTEQAATVDAFSSAISRVQDQTVENSGVASQTFEQTQEAGRLMQSSMALMEEMTTSMHEISESSQNIGRVIKVIDDIAFQTNILALNAAVEAARAGQHGKGFAVVADEVRSLASKSAEAAKETAALIESSVRRVSEGSEIARKTGDSLREVSRIAASNADGMRTLSDSSQKQSDSIGEITDGIRQISTVVQANSATAQQSAASAEEMSAQSTVLIEIVSRFKLRDHAPVQTEHGFSV
jgi:methyl-accepting chemotaxis protein